MQEEYPIKKIETPSRLLEIPDRPSQLYVRGNASLFFDQLFFLTVVGSRTYSAYGKQVCERLVYGLQGYPIVIISGLALGIDGIAHRAALSADIPTVAVPGSGLNDSVLYPATHKSLAQDILQAGGALLSEFEPNWRARPDSFPKRNRIMAGLSHAVLVIEAETRSGTLITSRLATEYNRDVFAVPGPITSKTSEGPHMLIQKGAALIQQSEDIITALGITKKTKNEQQEFTVLQLTPVELSVYNALHFKPIPRDVLIQQLSLSVSEANILLSSLELRGYIIERLGCIEWCTS